MSLYPASLTDNRARHRWLHERAGEAGVDLTEVIQKIRRIRYGFRYAAYSVIALKRLSGHSLLEDLQLSRTRTESASNRGSPGLQVLSAIQEKLKDEEEQERQSKKCMAPDVVFSPREAEDVIDV